MIHYIVLNHFFSVFTHVQVHDITSSGYYFLVTKRIIREPLSSMLQVFMQ
jgi:hypothetical protein